MASPPQFQVSESEYPVSPWESEVTREETDGPTLTMTLPPLLLHTTSVQHQQQQLQQQISSNEEDVPDSRSSPSKFTTPCPLCNIDSHKVS